MGFMDWLKGTFGKQTCAFCGAEVGMLKRTKIKNKEFICNDCRGKCSRFIEVYRFTKDELMEHMEYMKRQEKMYNEVLGTPSVCVPGAGNELIEFYDEHGMFRIRNTDYDNRYTKELFRYDQVASYEPFCDEEAGDTSDKKVFKGCGVIINLVGSKVDTAEIGVGLRPHPYIDRPIKVTVNKRDQHIGTLDVNHIISHFDYIFGVNDDTKGLFSFGPTKQQKREGEALKAMGGMFSAAIKAAKNGGEVSEETKQQVMDAMNKVEDANTSGLAEYSRRADAAEEKVFGGNE